MRVLADVNIPFADDAFSTIGTVRLMPGRAISAQDLEDVDALMVRSITAVSAGLLSGTKVRFVGTATIGTDHVDIPWLQENGIGFASAPGCNANSVAEYVMAGILVLSSRRGEKPEEKSIGVVGVGNVGSRVAAKAEALGMRVLRNDPPLQRATADSQYVSLDAILECDFITLHVPLEREGPDATFHLADAAFLDRMHPDSAIINSSRGAVVDGNALLEACATGAIRDAVLDVWEGEPEISLELLESVSIATPHIAGYSLDGKIKGTAMIYQAACEFFGLDAVWRSEEAAPPTPVPSIVLQARGREESAVILEGVRQLYDIEADDAALRRLAALPPSQLGPAFDALRKNYPIRREFHHTRVVCPDAPASLKDKLAGIGFRVG